MIYENTLESWLYAIFIVLAGIIIGWVLAEILDFSIRKITSKTRSNLDDEIISKAKKPVQFMLFLLSVRYAAAQLVIHPEVEEKINRVLIFLVIMVVTWFISRLVNAVIFEMFDTSRKQEDAPQWETFSPVLQKGLRFGIWTIGFIMALNNAGFDVGALLAGLGIGGLALALASQDTVKNVIGGLIIVFDKPFALGDRVKVDAFEGIVEDIGLRSTRLRSLEGRLISIPNTLFSDKPIVNISREPERRIMITLQLAHENSIAKMQDALVFIKEVLHQHPLVNAENAEAFTSGFGPLGMEITVIYYIKLGHSFTQVQDEVNMKIREKFYAQQIQMAVSELR